MLRNLLLLDRPAFYLDLLMEPTKMGERTGSMCVPPLWSTDSRAIHFESVIRVMTILEEFDGDTSYPGSKSYSDIVLYASCDIRLVKSFVH